MKDPICGMDVEPSTAAAKETFKGSTYYFCSENCRKTFAAAPERYAASGRSAGPAAEGGSRPEQPGKKR